jgi:Arc/MetJ-type ribon-helix-helix transcriptional regulator
MPFDAGTLSLVEDALSEGFAYHNGLDAFLLRCGLEAKDLTKARGQADERGKASPRAFRKAPKRFVAQEVLALLAGKGAAGDIIVAAMITGFTRGDFSSASEKARQAISLLASKIATDREEKAEERRERAAELRERERADERRREQAATQAAASRETLLQRFMTLASEGNAQSRGYLLETFLNDLFEFEGLEPRGSFRIIGEQIDGSFKWRARSNLVEAKWVAAPVAGAEFGAFLYKLEGKSLDTRGLFISINGYSPEALAGLGSKGELRFVCLDGAHLVRALSPGASLPQILERIWRHADETGEAYLPNTRL